MQNRHRFHSHPPRPGSSSSSSSSSDSECEGRIRVRKSLSQQIDEQIARTHAEIDAAFRRSEAQSNAISDSLFGTGFSSRNTFSHHHHHSPQHRYQATCNAGPLQIVTSSNYPINYNSQPAGIYPSATYSNPQASYGNYSQPQAMGPLNIVAPAAISVPVNNAQPYYGTAQPASVATQGIFGVSTQIQTQPNHMYQPANVTGSPRFN